MNTPEIESILKSLGLTLYEIKTYLSLIEVSALSADQIHESTKIPTPRIYDTIDSLEKKGLVRVISGRPKRFEAIEPKIGFSVFLKQKKDELEETILKFKSDTENLTSLLDEPFYNSRYKIQPDELLEAIPSLDSMEAKTIELIANSKKEVCIFTNVFFWFENIEDELISAIKRNVSIRIIMSIEEPTSEKIAKKIASYGANVRIVRDETMLIRGTIADQNQVVFVIWASPEKFEKFIYRPHFSSNHGIATLFSNNFEYIWSKSKSL